MRLDQDDIKMIYGLKCFAFNYQDAEDMIHDIFLKILNNLERFNSLNTSEKKQYVIKAIYNWHRDKHRRVTSKGRVKYHVPLEFAEIAGRPDVYSKMEWKEVLKKGHGNENFARLKLNLEGYSCYEIAKMKGVKSHNTILQNFHYARILLNKK